MASDEGDDDFIAQEIANVETVLSLQSNPLKESAEAAALSGTGLASSSKARPPAISIELQRLEWLSEARTLRISAYPEASVSAGSDMATSTTGSLTRAQQLLLAPPIALDLFFPESLKDPPLCFGSTDAAALVAERANQTILPLERSSLLHAVSRIVSIIKREHLSIWPPTHDYLGAFRRDLSAHLRQHPTAADLLLSLLSMAKPHHPSVRFPLPRFFYRGLPGRDAVDQPALLAALSAVPPLASLVLQEGESGSGDKGGPPPFLPFASCVLLHHLFFRSRVALLDPPAATETPDDFHHRQLLQDAGITALPPADQPALVFQVAHAADARFTRPAQRHGTRVGFHGSAPGNFYSIVALGLRNLSGTRGMRNGAVFGEGVYLASKLEVAREFGDWGTRVWRHSALGVPPSFDDPSAPPVFAYQVIALCEFVAFDRYTKHLAAGKPASSSSSSSSSAPSSGTPTRRQQQQQQGAGTAAAAAAAAAAGESQYYVVEEDAHLVVRHLLLFKDPAVLSRQGKGNPSPARALPTPGSSTGTLTRRAAAGAGAEAGAGQAPGAAAGVAGAGAAGSARARRPRGWADHFFVFLRAVCFLVVLVMLLDGLERLLTKTGTLQHPSAKRGGGGGRKRGAR